MMIEVESYKIHQLIDIKIESYRGESKDRKEAYITNEDVENAILTLQNGKAPGTDGIKLQIIKDLRTVGSILISSIYRVYSARKVPHGIEKIQSYHLT